MKPAFDFFEVISVLPSAVIPKRLWGTQGVVLGRAESDVDGWEYAVQLFEDDDCCWQVHESALKSEGYSLSRDEVYTGECVNVPAEGAGSH